MPTGRTAALHGTRVCVGVVRCTWIMSRNDEPKHFTTRDQEHMVNNVIEPMASDGLRTICLAYKDYVPGITVSSCVPRQCK